MSEGFGAQKINEQGGVGDGAYHSAGDGKPEGLSKGIAIIQSPSALAECGKSDDVDNIW